MVMEVSSSQGQPVLMQAKSAQSTEGLPLGSKQPHGRTMRHRISKVGNQGHVPVEVSDTADSASTLTESTQAKSKNSENVDFMARNILDLASAAAVGRKKRDSKVPEVPANGNYGKVPPYLLRRKLELLQSKELRLQEEREKHLPPGLVLMKEEERLEVLKTLEDNKEKLVGKLRDFPLVVETPSQVRTKGEIHSQLKDVEESIKRFSRPKVYIRYTN